MYIFGVLLILVINLNHSYQQGVCPQGTNCFWRYPYFLTKRLHCDVLSSNCRTGYMCCWNCHFSHPVCVRVNTNPAIPSFGGYPLVPSFGNYPQIPSFGNYPQIPSFGKYPQVPSNEFFPLGYNKPVKHKQRVTENNYFMNFLHQCKIPNVPTSNFPGVNLNKICQSDNDCPVDQFCSQILKICVKIAKDITNEVTFLTTTLSPVAVTYNLETNEESPNCPLDTTRCNANDVTYECDVDDDCLYFEVCCYSNCHKTKICKNKVKANIIASSCPKVDTGNNCDIEENEENKCNIDEDCPKDFSCCENPCLNYKTCVRDPHKKTEMENCPKLEEKCTVPYSLRIANKFRCEEDSDCKLGEKCCEDPCIEYFKVCKLIFGSDNYTTQDFISAIFKTPNDTNAHRTFV